MCYYEDGRLLVSRAAQHTPPVRGFVARLERHGKPVEQILVDPNTVADAYGKTAEGKPRTKTDMQHTARALFIRGVEIHASDIHIRVHRRGNSEIIFRIHSDLELVDEHPFDYCDQLCTTIYVAMTDISDPTFEPLSRQDARISDPEKLHAELDGIRVATTPTATGYLMVLRLLYNDTTETTDVRALGYIDNQSEAIDELKRRPTGISVIAGPTGSGKSTTLQRILASVIEETKGRKHVMTVEDPPEYPIPGAVQTPVANVETDEERSRAFQAAIKATLRLDPDVIMIGEVRDGPSARLAVQAAMTGHQVWTTLHANGALAIIDRLIDIGVSIEILADPTVICGLICQRLVKVLCPKCKKPFHEVSQQFSKRDVERLTGVVDLKKAFVQGSGCEHCRRRGTVGRTVIAEVVVTDEHLMSLVRKRDRIGAREYWRKSLGGMTILEHAVEKVHAGLIDPFRVEQLGMRLDDIGLASAATQGDQYAK